MSSVGLEPKAESAAQPVLESKNPGGWEELHVKVKALFPQCFSGARVDILRPLNSRFQVTHRLKLSPATSGYDFGAVYVGQPVGSTEPSPFMNAETDIFGNSNAVFMHQFAERWRLVTRSSIKKGAFEGVQATVERRGPNSTYGFTIANLDLVNDRGIFVGNILRRITDRLDIGAQINCQVDKKQIPGKKISLLTYALRYTMPNWVFAATLGSAEVNLSYYHKLNEHFHAGVELETNLRFQESKATVGYMADIPETGFTIRGSCDTDWNVSALLEKKLYGNSPFTLLLSGLINHVKAQGHFGVGLQIEPPRQ